MEGTSPFACDAVMLRRSGSILCASLIACSVATSQQLVFTAGPDGGQQVPPNASAGVGSATFVLDRAANSLAYELTVRKLTGTETEAHLHGFAPPGQNAGVLLVLPLGKHKKGVWSYPEALEDMLVSGEVYVDVHTDAFPGGEVRGQWVLRADDAVFTVSMNSAQASGSNSSAKGSGFLRADTLIDRAHFDITIAGLQSSELASHVHAGAVGQTGPILFTLPNGPNKAGIWDYLASEEPGLLAGDTYANVHTQTFLQGEIRGQIVLAATNPDGYCASKTNSQGCVPAIAWSGTPTVTGPDDLTFTCVQVLNQTTGIFFWGTAPKSSLFFGGTLCVRAPTRRTPVTASGGNPPPDDCSGSFSFHFSQADMTAKGLGAGSIVYGQWWYLDPHHPDGTGVGLSDGVQFELRP